MHADDWAVHWAGTDRADPYAAPIIDHEIWGRGAADQKAGICAVLEALRAIGRTGHRPKGSVTALFVCDEESGQPGSGVSAGMKAALADGTSRSTTRPISSFTPNPRPRPSTPRRWGFLIADITLTGRSAYFGRPELGIDALQAGHTLLSKLWNHSDDLRAQPHTPNRRGILLVTKVNSGGNIAVPGAFQLSLIRKVLPDENLDSAANAIRDIAAQVASDHGVKASVEFSAPRDHPWAARRMRSRPTTLRCRPWERRSPRSLAVHPGSRPHRFGRRSHSSPRAACPACTSHLEISPIATPRSNAWRSMNSWPPPAPSPISWRRGADSKKPQPPNQGESYETPQEIEMARFQRSGCCLRIGGRGLRQRRRQQSTRCNPRAGNCRAHCNRRLAR